MTDTSQPDTEHPQEPIDAQFEPAPDPEPAPKTTSRGPGWAGLGLGVVIAAAAGAAGGIYGADYVRPNPLPALQQEVSDLTAQQAEFERRIAEMPEASDEISALMKDVSNTSRKLDELLASGPDTSAIDSLTARLDALETINPQTSNAAPEDILRALTALETRLAALEAMPAPTSAPFSPEPPETPPVSRTDPPVPPPNQPDPRSAERHSEAALALSSIEAAARRGSSFEADYRVLRASLPSNQTVRRLAPYVSGVRTLSALQAEFSSVRTSVLAAAKADAPQAAESRLSWLNRVLGDAVSVRPADQPEDPALAALDAASLALTTGDLSASVRALAALEGNAARAAQDWTREANRRITLEAVLEDIRLSLIEPEN